MLWDAALPVGIFLFPSPFLRLSQSPCKPSVMTANQAHKLSHGACSPVGSASGLGRVVSLFGAQGSKLENK